jgi:hypothetical protein
MMRLLGLLLFLVLSSGAHAESGFALLIGNQAYTEKVGPLKNPHNDIALVGTALEKLGFKVTRIEDAGYKAIDTALKRHIQQVRRAGKDTISLVYYSGHGAADPDTQINYLIPIDVSSADDAEVWTNSIDLREIVNRLREQSPDAVHYVIFDACREELRLTRAGKKALEQKGFVPVANISGVMIAYATAPGKTASDTGDGGGVYAKTLAAEIVRPGVESVMMFRNVQLKVKEMIGQDPWLSFPTLPAVYFAGRATPEGPGPERQIEIAFWQSVKDNKNPAVVAAYLERYPNGEFAPTARALIAELEERLRAERVSREEEMKRQDEALKAAEARQLEEERRVHEAAQAAEERRADELRKALEQIRSAREAVKAAEKQREVAIRATEEAKSRAKLASLPPAGEEKRLPENIVDDPVALARAVQTELKRVGCDPGVIDGKWGADARDALGQFIRFAKIDLQSEEPSYAALNAVTRQMSRVCPETPRHRTKPKQRVPREPSRQPAAAEKKEGRQLCWGGGIARNVFPCPAR